MKTIILFSGGLDSTVCLGWAKNRYETIALSIFYGQKNNSHIFYTKDVVFFPIHIQPLPLWSFAIQF